MARRALEFRNPWYMLPDTPPTRGYLAALWDASPATAALVDPQGLGKGAPAQSPEAAGAGGGGGRASVGRLARMSRVRAASAEQLPAVDPAEPSTLGALPMDVFNACAAATCGIMASVPTSPGQFALWPATRPEALVVWPLWAMKYCAAVDYPTEDVVALPVPGAPTESPVQQAVPAALPSAVPQRLVRPARVNSSGERPPPLPDRSRKHSVSSTPSRPPPRRSMEATTLPEARAGVGSELPQPPAAPHSSPPGQ
ncbi:unnamed protein product [Symbiodinium sp. KB8]|nr:unnamed protein product [Symbiodinium sp. KB8]